MNDSAVEAGERLLAKLESLIGSVEFFHGPHFYHCHWSKQKPSVDGKYGNAKATQVPQTKVIISRYEDGIMGKRTAASFIVKGLLNSETAKDFALRKIKVAVVKQEPWAVSPINKRIAL